MDFDKKELSTYLDGVPFMVGSKFCPPRNVPLPEDALSYEPPSELLSEEGYEYDFSLESKVLADIKSKKEKVEEPPVDQPTKSTALKAPPVLNGAAISAQQVNASIPLWPAAASILQPKSKSLSNDVPSVRSDIMKKINLSDFENDTPSPFDYMELQTINDIEELNTVFQGLCKTQKETTVAKPPAADDETAVPSSEELQNVGNVSKSISFPLPEAFDLSKPTAEENSKPQSTATSTSSISSVSKSFVKNSESYLSYSYPNMPGAFSGKSGTIWSSDKTKRNSFTSGSISPTSFALSQVPSVQSNSSQNRKFTESHREESDYPSVPLRSSKSIPDLTNPLPNDEVMPKIERSHTPPARRVTYRPNNSEDENTYVKMPYLDSTPKHNVWSSNGLLTCTAVHSDKTGEVEQKQQLSDPYNELNNSERQIVDFITDMGFHRGQVSRTVKHLGTDEKKVVEHLCQIQALEESGYDKLEAETALHLHDYDKHEAIRYLDLLNQFQDLGFEKEAIRKALVQNKNDRDKVIDALLS